ncbi:4F2 cell-surface antigen heavy chain-like [Morone saxatilis]|uniref:4F2 cell-surface antigen heavy chain-like n=1 Tax=Morone saxatilis TaxID=34816 RepID=UPI0015E21E92|nr:4F2 cell-surface antigen heavy chain-like [Morone saxatilis]
MRLSVRFPAAAAVAAAAPPSSSSSAPAGVPPHGIRPGDRFSSKKSQCVSHQHPAATTPQYPRSDVTGRFKSRKQPGSSDRWDAHKSPLPLRRVHRAPCPSVGTGVTSIIRCRGAVLRCSAARPCRQRLFAARQAGEERRRGGESALRGAAVKKRQKRSVLGGFYRYFCGSGSESKLAGIIWTLSALVFWLNEGVDGVQLSGVERVASVVPSLWTDIRAIIQNGTSPKKRVLIGVTERSSAEDVSALLNSTGVDLLISRVLLHNNKEHAQSVQLLYSSHIQTKLAWSLGGRAEGHLASLVGPAQVKQHQLLLLTLPGTPVINYGDEIGLMDEGTKFPRMLWDSDEELNGTLQEERAERLSCRSFFRSLSELRGKERSLLFGDFFLLTNSSSSSVAYLRLWDQSERYLAAFNWAEEAAVLQLTDALLPRHAVVVHSTNSSALPADKSVDLTYLRLGPGQAALLRFPYTG